MQRVLLVLVLLLSFCCLFLFYKISKLDEAMSHAAETGKTKPAVSHTVKTEKEEIELVHYMNRIQQFHAKLYFAGMANNEELVEFYLHELEEEMEAIEKAGVVEDGINISELIRVFGLNQIKWLENELKNPEHDFKQAFETFTTSCNGCHQSSGHPYIKITVPSVSPVSNQDFSPVK